MATTNMKKDSPKTRRRKVTKNIGHGACHIQCSFNNTIVTFTDDAGNAEILPGCELTASRGKDSVAYWNVKVVPGNTVIMTA